MLTRRRSCGDLERVDVLAVERDAPAAGGAVGVSSASRFSERSSVVLPQPDGPISASTSPWRHRQRHVVDRDLAARRRSSRSSMRMRSGPATRGARRRGGRRRRGRGRARAPGAAGRGATTVGGSSTTIRRIGGGISVFHAEPSARRGDQVDHEVERDHDDQQHERGRVGLLRRVALARRRVVVDVARQRRAGAAQRAEQRRPARRRCSCSVAPSRITTIAVSPAIRPIPSAVPVAMPGRARRQQHAPDRRRLASCRARTRPRARGAGSPAAPRAWRRRSAAARSAPSSRRR